MSLPHLRVVQTERTIWQFDEIAMRFLRIPKGENLAHPSKPYTGVWEPYTDIIECTYRDGWTELFIVQPDHPGTIVWVPPSQEKAG